MVLGGGNVPADVESDGEAVQDAARSINAGAHLDMGSRYRRRQSAGATGPTSATDQPRATL